MKIDFCGNLPIAQRNPRNAYSNIMNIDFSKETIIFTKMKALAQANVLSP